MTPASRSTSSSMKQFPLTSRLGLVKISYAASAMICAERQRATSSAPRMFRMAAVSIVVRGHKAFDAIPY
ncbi:Uncharacterised protein [Mycobacteroides abscessus subsp. abscessus]|nr:Uncharacterised protein [Mycobacteroides abscessus subsp. abscessus]SIN56849.1 Uncharacterised protein [Mycobacteroides abscessus subsp. abscessus]